MEHLEEYYNRDVFHWRALYIDNTSYGEFNDEPTGAGLAIVDLSRCVGLILEPMRENLMPHAVQVDLAKGQRVLFKRRRVHSLNPEIGPVTIHMLGYSMPIGDTVFEHWTYILPDGRCLHTTDAEVSW
jgi:hypothetical protein